MPESVKYEQITELLSFIKINYGVNEIADFNLE